MKKFALVLALTIPLIACGAYQLDDQERMITELGAQDYAGRSGGKFVSCSGQDSDGDNYVTCTIQTATQGNTPGSEQELLCSYSSRGCKRKS